MNGRVIRNFKINDYLKFYFINGWNLPLMEQIEIVGTCPALTLTSCLTSILYPIHKNVKFKR